MLKRILKVFAGLVVVLLILTGPTLVFWYQWMMPSERFPADIGEHAQNAGSSSLALETQFADFLVESRASAGAPSLSAAIARNGELIWAGTNGFSDMESATAATPEQVYRLGSVSKPLATLILARLIEEDRISLSSRAGDIAPDLPPHLHDITVGQLASHTGGVRHYHRRPTWWPPNNESITAEHFPDVKAGLSLFINDDLVFEPGTNFSYTTFGYSLLSYLMEQSAGMSFGEMLPHYLNAPLDVDLRLDDVTIEMSDRASTYMTEKGRWGAAYPSDPSYKWAGGGIVARPTDLVMIGQALLSGEFLAAETRDVLWQPVALPGSETNPQNYAIGWRVDTSVGTLGEDAPTLMIHHGGRQMGGVSFWALYPELGISVAVIANTGSGEVRGEVQTTAYALVRALVASQQ